MAEIADSGRRRPDNMTLAMLRCGLAALVTLAAGGALAADIAAPQRQVYTAPERLYDIVFELGGGVEYRPAYEGASKYEVSPEVFGDLHFLWLPGFGVVKDQRLSPGFSFSPSFRYVLERKSQDYSQIAGLNDIDAAFELGGKVGYRFGAFNMFAALRHGFGGHDGLIGEAGLDYTFRPTEVTEISIGPRVSYANEDYMRTYFGVTPLESALSNLRAYDPGGGLKGYGFEISGRYEFTPVWTLVGSLAYEKLAGDAADSPIVQAGDENQFTAKLGLTYKFALKLFGN